MQRDMRMTSLTPRRLRARLSGRWRRRRVVWCPRAASPRAAKSRWVSESIWPDATPARPLRARGRTRSRRVRVCCVRQVWRDGTLLMPTSIAFARAPGRLPRRVVCPAPCKEWVRQVRLCVELPRNKVELAAPQNRQQVAHGRVHSAWLQPSRPSQSRYVGCVCVCVCVTMLALTANCDITWVNCVCAS